jgi:hypothetical protein
MDFLQRLLLLLLSNIFPILAAVAGIVIAALLRSRAPRPALILLMACVLQLVARLVSGWYYVVYMPQSQHYYSASELVRINVVVGVVFGVLQAVDFGLLIWAVAADRRRPAFPPAMPMR